MIYRGSGGDYRFTLKDFHKECDNKGATLTIIYSISFKGEIKIFGAYTDINLKLEGGYREGNGNSFIFYLNDDFNFVKFRCKNLKNEV